jgi:hypothetical protein
MNARARHNALEGACVIRSERTSDGVVIRVRVLSTIFKCGLDSLSALAFAIENNGAYATDSI